MAFTGTSTTSLSKLIKDFYSLTFLTRAEDVMVAEQFCAKKPLPLNEGDTIRFQRYKNLDVATTPLTEGVLPAITQLSSEEVTAKVEEYGSYTTISKLLADVAIDPKISQAAEVFGYNAAKTRDRLIINEMGAYGTEQVAGGKTDISELTNISDFVISTTEVRKALKTLRTNNAMTMDGGFYIGIMNPAVEFDLEGDSDWVSAARYEGSEQLWKGEIGRWMGVRFVRSSETYTQTSAGVVDYSTGGIYSTHILGKESVGIVPLGEGKPKIYIKTSGDGDTSQPLPRYHTVGWMGTFTQVVLNDDFIVNIKSRATGQATV